MHSTLQKSAKISFLSLATLPLVKENINSIFIIICLVFTVIMLFTGKQKGTLFSKEFWIVSTPFWMFLIHEVLSFDLSTKRILLYLPFLALPFIFSINSCHINKRDKNLALLIFQISAFLQSLIYLGVFLATNSYKKIFDISLENVPYFREYVFTNYLFEIHPTYFSSFLLISFTISFFKLIKLNNKNSIIFNSINVFFTTFFIFLFSSKIVLLILIMSIFYLLFTKVVMNKVSKTPFILGALVLLILMALPFKNILMERFDEIRTEYNKPIVNTYYNSINTRVIIFKCSVILLKDTPFWGYGDSLQNELNNCYSENTESDFYKWHTFNTHNYYFNLLLYGGFIFLFLFLFYLLFIGRLLSISSLGLIIFIQLLIINLTENYLSRHYGIVTFTYFISLFIFTSNSNKNNCIE